MKLLRKITAYLLLFIVWDNLDLSMAQTSGLPAPRISPPQTLSATEALFANLTGCATATYVLVPASGDCVAPSGQTFPASGIMVSTGSAFGTSLTAPSGTIVGTTDTQTLTNKTLDGVTPTTMGYVDPTSSIQTQLNGKAATGNNSSITQLSGLTTPIGIVASYESVASSTTPTFSNTVRYSTNILTASVTSFTLAAPSANYYGQDKVLTFCQNATGGYTVTPPSNVHGFMTVGTTLSKCSSQHFNYDESQTAWLSDGPGVINE
jgi:hypothetical protein